jgi:hypothetical protein
MSHKNNNERKFGNHNPNERIFYTQEGTPYYVRRATQRIGVFDGSANPLYFVAVFQPDQSLNSWAANQPFSSISIQNSTKPVIPIMLNYQAIDVSNSPNPPYPTVANLQLPYYTLQNTFAPGGQNGLANLKPLVKMMPFISVLESDPGFLSYAYNCRYDLPTFAQDDFIEVQGSAAFIFTTSAANAFNGLHNKLTLPSANVSATMSLLYFELQK